MQVKVIEYADWARRLGKAWTELQADSETATPFQTLQWHRNWHRHFGGKPVILTAQEDNVIHGIFPLVRKRTGWTTLRPMGVGPADYLHPLLRTGRELEVWESMERWLGSVSANIIDLHQLSERNEFVEEEGESLLNATCLVVDLPTSFDEYLGRLSKSLRYDVRKLDKKLFQEGKARIYEPEDLAEGLTILFEQHRKRWRSKGLPGAFSSKMENFHRDWASSAHVRGWLRLRVLEYEGKPIGAIYAMTFNKVCYYYQAGFDPAYSSISPGTLLVAHTIREAIEEGVEQFDFCRGDEPYKRRWQPDHIYQNRRVLLSRGSMGGVGLAYLRKAWKIEEKLRAKFEGGSLFERRKRE